MQIDIKTIGTFDGRYAKDVYFSWYGDPIYRIKIIINDESGIHRWDRIWKSDAPIFDNFVTIPANTLENNIYYVAYIQVCTNLSTKEDDEETWSDIQPLGETFKVITTPSVSFTKPTAGQTIESSTYTFELRYAYVLGSDPLREWKIDIKDKDAANTIVASSDNQFYYGSETPVKVQYKFNGLINGHSYTAEATVLTSTGMEVRTSIDFKQSIPAKDKFYILDANNNDCDGSIDVQSHIAIVDGFLYWDPEQHINDKYLNLRHNGVYYKSGFSAPEDFTLSVLVADLDPGEEIAFVTDSVWNRKTGAYSNMKQLIAINYLEGYFGGTYNPETGLYEQNDDYKSMFELVVIPIEDDYVHYVDETVDYQTMGETERDNYFISKSNSSIQMPNLGVYNSDLSVNVAGYSYKMDGDSPIIDRTKTRTAHSITRPYSMANVYYSNLIDPVKPEDFVRINVVRKVYTQPISLKKSVFWEIGAAYDSSDMSILMSHADMEAYTHAYLENYTHRQIRSNKPIDWPK